MTQQDEQIVRVRVEAKEGAAESNDLLISHWYSTKHVISEIHLHSSKNYSQNEGASERVIEIEGDGVLRLKRRDLCL
jgi:hypothetical protein